MATSSPPAFKSSGESPQAFMTDCESDAAVGRCASRDGRLGAGLGRWASSKDPILQRYGVGALSRVATSSPRAFEAVVDAGCLSALVAATNSDDAQAQCFAAGAIGPQPPFSCICAMWVSTRHS